MFRFLIIFFFRNFECSGQFGESASGSGGDGAIFATLDVTSVANREHVFVVFLGCVLVVKWECRGSLL